MSLFFNGFFISLSLIVAIGSQNAYVLKQGIARNHIFWVISICFICDFLLITLGIWGVGVVINNSVYMKSGLAILGAMFLFFYGIRSFYSAYVITKGMDISKKTQSTNKELIPAILTTLAVTLLNPHVYIDTVVIIGGIAGGLVVQEKIMFMLGALVASFLWFYSLGYGARLLTPIFQSVTTWRILDTVIGIIMWYIAYQLIMLY